MRELKRIKETLNNEGIEMPYLRRGYRTNREGRYMPLKLELGDVVQMKKSTLQRRPVGGCANRNGYKDKVPKMRRQVLMPR